MFGRLFHSGTPHEGSTPHSGRHPWGSGENPYQRTKWFRDEVAKLKLQGLTDEKDIRTALGLKSTEYRALVTVTKEQQDNARMTKILEYKDKGLSWTEMGRRMDLNESTVRALYKRAATRRNNITYQTAEMLKKNIADGKCLDVGKGVEREIEIPGVSGISKERLKASLARLQAEGYNVYTIHVEQATNPDNYTPVKVLAPPGVSYDYVVKHKNEIKSIKDYTVDGGETWKSMQYPQSISSDRVKIKYAEDGGKDMDGVIQLRPGVEDISLGNSHYAQVRIGVDDTHFLKGMAIYGEEKDFPDGIDILYNSNKHRGTPPEKVFKEMKKIREGSNENDPDNPFGAAIKSGGQRTYIGEDGKEHLSVINKVNEEGDWNEWSRTLSSQFLSKQNLPTIKKQLNLAYADRAAEFDEISNLTNPNVKKKLLASFAEDCDSAAVHLKAASFPGQVSKVILPVPQLADDEIYAPSFEGGTKVALVRYPHGGTFEIPELTVNNKNRTAKKLLGNAIDAVGINGSVAERLSGADFDGDTVIVIPLKNGVKVKTSKPLKGLEGFDPKEKYPSYEGMKVMTEQQKGIEMGKVSNLITDMTLQGADPDEVAAAVRHSMVVIDAPKHKLDWKRSEKENHIAELKDKYQRQPDGRHGAATLISRSKSEVHLDVKRDRFNIRRDTDPKTGEKIYRESEPTSWVDKDGKTHKGKTTTSTRMAEVKDARELSSGTPQEELYADYANKLKALANNARKLYLSTDNIRQNKTAKETYSNEVSSIKAKLDLAIKNAPKERAAQLMASYVVEQKVKANPELKEKQYKKERQKIANQALATARGRLGAHKQDVQIKLTDKEWEAIQSGAISSSMLDEVLNNMSEDYVRELATPRVKITVSPAVQAKIRSMSASGYTIAEIAEAVGRSSSTVSEYLN